MANQRNTKENFLVLNAATIARAHTILAGVAFSSALGIGCFLHFKRIVKNGVAGYPDEWFPSVSATIGDWYPERNVFQILIAITSGPRFAIGYMQYLLHRTHTSSIPLLVFIFGLIRTLSCGGWVYITSSDDHDVHDLMMITYMVCNIPWMLGGIKATPIKNGSARKNRIYIASLFFSSLIPLIYFFIQHKVYRVPGAYTRYSFFEWGLIFFDIFYDAVTEQEFREAQLQISLFSLLATTPVPDEIDAANKASDIQNLSNSPEKARTDVLRTILEPPPMVPSTSWNNFYSSVASRDWRSTFSFSSDVYLSYLFWTLLTSLIPTLFFFSVWELGIAGHELALLSTLSPILLGISPLLTWARSRSGQTSLHLLSFTGLAAYLIDEPLQRLQVVAFATVMLVMRQVAQWVATDRKDVGYMGILTGLGLLLSSISKHANHANNPLWPFINAKSGGYNKIGLALALLSVYEFYTRPTERVPPPIPSSKVDSEAAPSRVPSVAHLSVFSAALPLGSLIFTLHNHFADSSTIIAWSWTGYKNGLPRGPVPHLHGAITIIVQSVGLLLPVLLSYSRPSTSNAYPSILSHYFWYIYGAASAYIMYGFRNWFGYAGGLNFAIFLMSVTPLVLQRSIESGKVARTYGTVFLVYCLFNLASIFTVAYAFVPGGEYFRERTDIVILVQMICLAPAFSWPFSVSRIPMSDINISRSRASQAKSLLACISVLSVLISMYRAPSVPRPFKSGPRILTAGIWTLHFGIDNEGHDSQKGVRNLIRDMELDVVGFLETDLHRTSFGHRDLTRLVVEDMGYHVDIGPGPNSHTWGCVLLSKFPIINSTHHLLPSPKGELAPAIEAVLDVYGTAVTVVVAHNGQEETPLDRELQSKELARIMSGSYPLPLIFLGYVVTKPHAKRPNPYEIMVKDGRVHDIDSDDVDRWCEYIFYRGLYRTSYARISRGIITDTEMQIGQFVLPPHGEAVIDDSEKARYLRSRKEELSIAHWLPMAYYGDETKGGVDGHFYHVFNTPLYYQIPSGAVL